MWRTIPGLIVEWFERHLRDSKTFVFEPAEGYGKCLGKTTREL
jgi:hypothetical protein